jgi:hypothetical protein
MRTYPDHQDPLLGDGVVEGQPRRGSGELFSSGAQIASSRQQLKLCSAFAKTPEKARSSSSPLAGFDPSLAVEAAATSVATCAEATARGTRGLGGYRISEPDPVASAGRNAAL